MRQGLVGQKVAVVGPGWLGGELARALVADGATVWTIRRGAPTTVIDGTTPLTGDIRTVGDRADSSWSTALPSQLDHVVATIAPGRQVSDTHASVYPAAVRGALALAERTGARSVVYTSSTGVYGQRDGRWVRESDPLEARDERQGALIAAELMLQQSTSPCARTILRPAGLYGPGRDPAPRYRASTPIGDADGWTNFSWRDDVVAAICHLLVTPPAPGACAVFNCTDNTPLRASTIARALGAPAPLAESAPTSSLARSNQRVDSRALLATGWTPRMCTVLDGLAALGHTVDRTVLGEQR